MTKDEAREFFAEKNRRRRRFKGTAYYREGRRARRDLANNGAFGNRSKDTWNLCVVGTTGSIR